MSVADSWLERMGQPPMSIGSRISWHSKELRNCRALTRQRQLIWSDYHQPSEPRSPSLWICKIFPLQRKTFETKDSTCKWSITPIPMTRHDPPLLISRLLLITKKFGQKSTCQSLPISSSPSWKSRSLTFAGIGSGMGVSRRRTSQPLSSRILKKTASCVLASFRPSMGTRRPHRLGGAHRRGAPYSSHRAPQGVR